MSKFKLTALLSLSTLFVPAFGQGMNSARPGTLNYIEGNATINGQLVPPRAAGVELQPGQTLATTAGKAEVLLTPGVFLRLDDNSAVSMVSPDLAKTEIRLDKGRAEIEADQLYKQNDLLVDVDGAQARVLDHGLYEFNATTGDVRVFDGKAAVTEASAAKAVDVKGGHDLLLAAEPLKEKGFNRNDAQYNDTLYNWSNLRAEYLGEANLSLAQEYAGAPGLYAGYGAGWDYDPALYAYTWLPGDGLFWSPFGYGFYSPFYLYGGGFVYGRGFYGRGGYYGRPGVVAGNGGFRGGATGGGGFHGGGGGGFHGGGGGRGR
jgi:hypothetical protein